MTWGRCNFLIVHISGDVSPPAKLHVSTFRVSVYRGSNPKTLKHYTLKTLEFTGLLLDTRGVASYNVTRVFIRVRRPGDEKLYKLRSTRQGKQ